MSDYLDKSYRELNRSARCYMGEQYPDTDRGDSDPNVGTVTALQVR